MEWTELNCILEALDILVYKHRKKAMDDTLSEDERSDVSNDLAYAEILLHKYQEARDKMASENGVGQFKTTTLETEP